MVYKARIKPKSLKAIIKQCFLLLGIITPILCLFLWISGVRYGIEIDQKRIIRAIYTQDNVIIDSLIITSANGNHNRFSIVFPPKKDL